MFRMPREVGARYVQFRRMVSIGVRQPGHDKRRPQECLPAEPYQLGAEEAAKKGGLA
jgi:hypothetical protein